MDLSEQEREEIQRVRRHAELDSKFRGLVSSMGLFQYALVPVGICLCIMGCRQHGRAMHALFIACLLIHGIAAGLMIYREYFPSLGW